MLSRSQIWAGIKTIYAQRIDILSLVERRPHKIIAICEANLCYDQEERYIIQYGNKNRQYKTGAGAIDVKLTDLYKLYEELYNRRILDNSYMKMNCRRILGWKDWNRPGSAMLAILPLLDKNIIVTDGTLSV